MLQNYLRRENSDYEISYITIRKAIGVLGILLPLELWIGMKIRGCNNLPDSISNYYFTEMGAVMTGTLCVVAMFLYAYRGKQKIDTVVSNFASLFALGIAFFPNRADFDAEQCFVTHLDPNKTIATIHFISAALFLLTLAGMSLFLFTKTDQAYIKKPKRNRNMVYRVCGWTIVAAVVLLAAYFVYTELLHGDPVKRLVFYLETIALVAFGISWLTKAELLFPDHPRGDGTGSG